VRLPEQRDDVVVRTTTVALAGCAAGLGVSLLGAFTKVSTAGLALTVASVALLLISLTRLAVRRARVRLRAVHDGSAPPA
jgi:uncharacterized membrane protein